MRFRPAVALVFGLLAARVLERPALADTARERKPAKAGARDKGDKEGKADTGAKPLKEIVGSAEKVEGLMTFHRSAEKLWLELPPSLVGAPLGFAAINVTALGDYATRGNDFDSQLVRWDRRGDFLVLHKDNLDFRATPGSAREEALKRSFPPSPVFSGRLERVTGEPAPMLVDATKLFGDALAPLLPDDGRFSVESSESILVSLRAFPDNVVARVSHRIKRKGSEGGPQGSRGDFRSFREPGRLADSRTAEILVDYDFFRLPETPFEARRADPRMGGFVHEHKDYSEVDGKSSLFQHVLVRWDLRKKDPQAAVSEPVEPITFTLDRSVPPEWRSLVRDSASWWNAAFEKVGFRNAVRILDPPEDASWDPADVHHSVIYWNYSDNLVFSGVAGPSLSDPRNGRVLKANVWLNGEFFSYALHRYLVYAWWRAPVAGQQDEMALPDREELRRLRADGWTCDRAPSFSSQMAFARLVLLSRGILKPGTAEADRFAREAFMELVAHEVGHALGFPHNWKASRISTWEDVEQGRVAGSGPKPFSASIMDYNPIYLAPRGKPQGDYFMRGVGPYDELAVRYLYAPLDGMSDAQRARELDSIAGLAEVSPGLAFDDGGTGDIDPTTNSDDLGDDSLAFSESRLAMLREEVLPKLPELVLAEGHDYPMLRQALDSAVFSVAMDYIDIVARHVGGQVLMRRVASSAASPEGGPAPITPVSAADQRRALDILERHVLADGAFALSPRTLAQLEADQLYDWNHPWRHQTDYSIGGRIAGLQETALSTLLQPPRLTRVLDNERRVVSRDAFTLPELFTRLERAAFSGAASPSADRRSLQRLLVSHLETLVVSPPRGTPAEASQVAAASLRSIRRRCEAQLAKPAGLDAYAIAHDQALVAQAKRALEAELELKPAG